MSAPTSGQLETARLREELVEAGYGPLLSFRGVWADVRHDPRFLSRISRANRVKFGGLGSRPVPNVVLPTDPDLLARVEAGCGRMEARLAQRAMERANLNVSIELRLAPKTLPTSAACGSDVSLLASASANGVGGRTADSGSVRYARPS